MPTTNHQPCANNPRRPAVGITIEHEGKKYKTVEGQPKHGDLVLTLARQTPYTFSDTPNHNDWLNINACTLLILSDNAGSNSISQQLQ